MFARRPHSLMLRLMRKTICRCLMNMPARTTWLATHLYIFSIVLSGLAYCFFVVALHVMFLTLLTIIVTVSQRITICFQHTGKARDRKLFHRALWGTTNVINDFLPERGKRMPTPFILAQTLITLSNLELSQRSSKQNCAPASLTCFIFFNFDLYHANNVLFTPNLVNAVSSMLVVQVLIATSCQHFSLDRPTYLQRYQ